MSLHVPFRFVVVGRVSVVNLVRAGAYVLTAFFGAQPVSGFSEGLTPVIEPRTCSNTPRSRFMASTRAG